VTYAMSPMGADHTAGNAITLALDHLDPAVQLEPMRDLNLKTMVIDTLGLCLFTGRVSLGQPEIIEEIVAVYTGQKVTFNEMMKTAAACILRERAFNLQAGLTRFHDRIPGFMQTEKLPPHDTVFDIADQDLDRFYDFNEKG
jgi:aldehyde:ferredoxin oxidoreductase